MLQWSQSQFLQALGWATLNSFWQMAILWCVYTGVNHWFRLSAAVRYRAAVSAVLTGFCWFVATAVLYYQEQSTTYAFFQNAIPNSSSLLTACLFSASVTYLALLIFPAARLYKNWQFVQAIKQEGLGKAALNYRLFVQNIAGHLGIEKKVKLVVSNLISSPVTIGYLKPMILLPVAALNNLSTAQVEAILLHELSHIRRYDYLVNFVVSVVHTLLYFNPFVKFFMNALEAERETCCDELVLQFGYDKVGYASALLHLEKSAAQHRTLVLAAAGKHNLLTRIEKIVGMEKKKTFRLIQIVPLAAAMLCILLFNSVLIIQDAKTSSVMAYANDTVFVPWQLEQGGKKKATHLIQAPQTQRQRAESVTAASEIIIDIYEGQPAEAPSKASPLTAAVGNFIPVDFDEVEDGLTKEQKQEVKAALEGTKKAVSALQWKAIEASMADVMTKKEKAVVRQEFDREVNNVNWQNVEKHMKANYDKLNWQVINANVDRALAQVKSDSMQTVLAMALTELHKLEKNIQAQTKLKCNPVPDCSLSELDSAKQTLQRNLDSLRTTAKPKKIVRL